MSREVFRQDLAQFQIIINQEQAFHVRLSRTL
jgi:hypothetical protein